MDGLKEEKSQEFTEKLGLFPSPVDVDHPNEKEIQEVSGKLSQVRGLPHYLAQLRFAVVAFLRFSPRVGYRRITWVCVSSFQSLITTIQNLESISATLEDRNRYQA